MDELKKLVLEYRNKTIEGKRVDLVPVTRGKMNHVLYLRSQEKSKYFLNQEEGMTLAAQEQWFDSYQERLDGFSVTRKARSKELYAWAIFAKTAQALIV